MLEGNKRDLAARKFQSEVVEAALETIHLVILLGVLSKALNS
jgi:hypothetical protein